MDLSVCTVINLLKFFIQQKCFFSPSEMSNRSTNLSFSCFDKYSGNRLTSFSLPKTLILILLFLSNLLITLASAATGNSTSDQSSSSDCLINSFVILSECSLTGFKALVTHHLKHSASSFFILIIPFLLIKHFGSGM